MATRQAVGFAACIGAPQHEASATPTETETRWSPAGRTVIRFAGHYELMGGIYSHVLQPQNWEWTAKSAHFLHGLQTYLWGDIALALKMSPDLAP